MISAKDIQKLRIETGFGIMECKKALSDSNGDFEKAKKKLSKEGAAKAEKRKDRKTQFGVVEAYIHDGKMGSIVVLGCETDFVAKNDQFKNLAHDIAMQITSMDPQNIKELLSQPYIKDNDMTIDELIKNNIGKIGENIQIVDFKRFGL
jgi:elongation factor Ts